MNVHTATATPPCHIEVASKPTRIILAYYTEKKGDLRFDYDLANPEHVKKMFRTLIWAARSHIDVIISSQEI